MATIKDVARKAGVSVTTVSRYLNHHPYISEEKKEAIRDAMEELHYVQSSVATQLRSKKSNFIGLVVSRLSNPFFTELVDTIEHEARKAGYFLIVMQSYDDKEVEANMLKLLQQGLLAGLILCAIETDLKTLESYSQYGPILLCNHEAKGSNLPQVYTNQSTGTYEAFAYLANKGYRKIAYSTGGSLERQGHGDLRTQAFEQAIRDFNFIVKGEWIFPSTHTIADGQELAYKLLEMPNRPEAIFSNSDEVAIGILSVCQEQGIEVPKDLAIMGFDNQTYSALVQTPLTTIEQPISCLGQEALNKMLALIDGKDYQVKQDKLKLRLVERAST
ncbi:MULTISPECIES: LacI family DNA-binding transcriptional regulator [Aerococcus]|uniref:LacI family transcriptional regulator n=1 Tax=Aerococcus sanguinicola TaxID=119206 RepID=A0A5N1GGT2_9LACT|nr:MULTISPECIES: LacI family DNA-binding transcriptional regulator [Aerococcus]KAA9300133.1 LacI family transcriptional regulator [Aerococcus sanguinicola]MDK6369475.1 LacI family DNA-binding transcriptional regulator [Aerococcus sp. UMB9870]MDK6679962.1 LacI family DNA-binding transcriptional regulator [Aerococcus sp. UMB8608]MDK6686156.1 LacI family DNA-binding transcriptional regulator [Aerococcus sp. UMB8623]MDK6939936.1 LacI family DNA-binding transcriptional regulator [Aerococcus sp. UMB